MSLCLLLVAATAWLDAVWLTPRGMKLDCGKLPDLFGDLLEVDLCKRASPLLDAAVGVPCVLAAFNPDTSEDFFAMLKYVLLIRLIIMCCTTLPPAGRVESYTTLVEGSSYQVGCSGHAALLLLACLLLSANGNRTAWLTFAATVSLLIVLTRCHYTLDVIVAWLVVFRVFGVSEAQ